MSGTPKVALLIETAILDSGRPAIALDLSDRQLETDHPLSRLNEVASDSVAAAEMAAEHLMVAETFGRRSGSRSELSTSPTALRSKTSCASTVMAGVYLGAS